MSTSHYVLGVVSLVCIVGPWVVAAYLLRAALLPVTAGAQARLAETVLGLSGLIVTTEVVGAFPGGFRRWTLAAISAVVAAGVSLLAARRVGPRAPRAPRLGRWRPVRVIPAVAVFAATAQWLDGTISAYRTGIVQVESLHYHLSHAAFFVSTGTLWRPHEVSAGSDAAFHPLTVELLHALGMLTLRSDVLSIFINVLLLWLLFLAAWCAGERVGAGPAALTGVALLSVALPMGGSAGGTALNDVGVVALLLAAVALAGDVRPDASRAAGAWTGRAVVAGLALGLAIGAKLTAPGAALGLIVGWLWLRRRTDLRVSAVALVVPTLLTGSFFYLRDWWFFGSPLPTVGILGHTAVPMPALTGISFNVAHYLTDPHVIRHWYVVALHADFGFAWPVICALPLLGAALALRRGRSGDDRVLAFAATVGFVVFLFTPLGALGLPGKPVLFGSNVRYAIPCMSLGLLVLVRDPRLARRWWTSGVLFVLELTTLSVRGRWPTHSPTRGTEAALTLLAVAVVAVLVGRRSPRLLAGVVVVALAVVAVGGLPFTRHYERHRYAAGGTPYAAVFRWAGTLHDQRIGFVGFPQTYPFFGSDFSNSVVYLGQAEPHHAFNNFAACGPWVSEINAEHLQWVVVLTNVGNPSQFARFNRWMGEAGSVPVFANAAESVYRVRGPLSPACAGKVVSSSAQGAAS